MKFSLFALICTFALVQSNQARSTGSEEAFLGVPYDGQPTHNVRMPIPPGLEDQLLHPDCTWPDETLCSEQYFEQGIYS